MAKAGRVACFSVAYVEAEAGRARAQLLQRLFILRGSLDTGPRSGKSLAKGHIGIANCYFIGYKTSARLWLEVLQDGWDPGQVMVGIHGVAELPGTILQTRR